jgi:hypothetical protein
MQRRTETDGFAHDRAHMIDECIFIGTPPRFLWHANKEDRVDRRSMKSCICMNLYIGRRGNIRRPRLLFERFTKHNILGSTEHLLQPPLALLGWRAATSDCIQHIKELVEVKATTGCARRPTHRGDKYSIWPLAWFSLVI